MDSNGLNSLLLLASSRTSGFSAPRGSNQGPARAHVGTREPRCAFARTGARAGAPVACTLITYELQFWAASERQAGSRMGAEQSAEGKGGLASGK